MRIRLLLMIVLLFVMTAPGFAQLTPTATWAAQAAAQHTMSANVTYRTASNQQLKMDVYYRRDVTTPQPTLVYYHGGFWVAGAKETAILGLIPWLEAGWNVVNVEYRLGVATDATTLAPAAVDDSLCALRFIASLPANFNIDKNRIVVTGESAGGHLALAMGLIPESAGFGKECAGWASPPIGGRGGGAVPRPAALPPLPKVTAVINWFGIADVPDVINGTNRQAAAARWFGLTATDMPTPGMLELAGKLSPLTYVKAGLPPVITIHGNADNVVPYPQAVKLHEALTKANVPNQLVTIPGGGHGNFTAAQRVMIYTTIKEFLGKHTPKG
jgi:acetyl esterase/lipase